MPSLARPKLGNPLRSSPSMWLIACAGLLATGGMSAPRAQQVGNSVSKPVVQPLPSPEVSRLKTALRQLARNSRDVDALIEAGDASLAANDVDAAIGFFARAQNIAPSNPKMKVGLAASFARQQRPIEALQLFDEAQAAGASTKAVAADHALAYDLVGDNNAAMAFYRLALGQKEDTTTRRRFALSHAISGDRRAFEAVLAPLIKQQDFASYRTRAFGLAILGDEDEAIAIAEAVMPKNLSARIAPYLRYMPRLTKAQQAAAANFGSFPRAAQIGRDTAQIASYTGGSAGGRNADARLAPQGEPLGRRGDAISQRRRPDRGRSSAQAAPVPVEAVTETDIRQAARADRAAASDPMARAVAPRRVRVKRAAEATVPTTPKPEVVKSEIVKSEVKLEPAPTPVVAATDAKVPVPTVTVTTNTVIDVPNAGFDLAKVSEPQSSPSSTGPSASPPELAAKTVSESESVAEAFASFATPPSTARPVSNGVDITKITPRRDVVKKPEAKPEKPVHPKRYWVQIATGRDRSALKFDWRRISRKAPDILGDFSPHVAAWGQTNRLLAGPFPNARDARKAMNALKEKEVDSFTFTSDEGQEIEQP